jgi:hypothetical protein
LTIFKNFIYNNLMTNTFGGSEQLPTGAPTAEAYPPAPVVSPDEAPAPADPNTLHDAGPMPSQEAFDANLTVGPTPKPTPSTTETAEATEDPAEREAFEKFMGIIDDAGSIRKQVDEMLQQPNPDETPPEEPYGWGITRFDEHRGAVVKIVGYSTYSHGVFVGADGKSIKIAKEAPPHTYEAVDPKDMRSVEAASEHTKLDLNGDRFRIFIQDPENPTLRVLINYDFNQRTLPYIIINNLNAEGRITDDWIRVQKPFYENRAIVERRGFKDLGDPFEIARRTLDFAKSATLKPVIPTAPQPTPTV